MREERIESTLFKLTGRVFDLEPEVRRLASTLAPDTSTRLSSSEIDSSLLAKIFSEIGSLQAFFESRA